MVCRRARARASGILAVALASAACGGPGPAAPSHPAPIEPLAPTAADLAVLAAADLADGTSDRTVKLCPGCALAMEGSSEHALEHAGYELHFCSACCREHFKEHPAAGIEALADVTAEEPDLGS